MLNVNEASSEPKYFQFKYMLRNKINQKHIDFPDSWKDYQDDDKKDAKALEEELRDQLKQIWLTQSQTIIDLTFERLFFFIEEQQLDEFKMLFELHKYPASILMETMKCGSTF